VSKKFKNTFTYNLKTTLKFLALFQLLTTSYSLAKREDYRCCSFQELVFLSFPCPFTPEKHNQESTKQKAPWGAILLISIRNLEARAEVEPTYTDLQRRHV